MAANVGGMGTPIGSGPNAVAISASGAAVTFVRWMLVGVPAVLGALLLAWALIRLLLLRKELPLVEAQQQQPPPITRGGWVVLALVSLTLIAWVSEPWHGIPSPTIALALGALLFISGLLAAEDFMRLDWSTIALIGGGIALGRLLEHTGVIAWLAQAGRRSWHRRIVIAQPVARDRIRIGESDVLLSWIVVLPPLEWNPLRQRIRSALGLPP